MICQLTPPPHTIAAIAAAAASDAAVARDTATSQDLARSLAGDGEAYRRLVVRHQAEIARQMRRFARDRATLDALVHDVFVEAYLSLRTYKADAPWIHWLRRIAVRVGYRHWQVSKRRAIEVPLAEDAAQVIVDVRALPATAVENAELVAALLGRLSPADRLVLTLVHLDGLSMEEAAARAGWTTVGTKVRAFRARRRLRRLLEGESS